MMSDNDLFIYSFIHLFIGQGIGRNLDGIVKPVKANLKFDTAGLGHNKADEFNNHWWEKAFNDAADNIHVQKRSDDISVTLKASESVEVVAENYSDLQMNQPVLQ